MTSLSINGGEKLKKYIEELSKKVSDSAAVKVGFLENATHDGNKSGKTVLLALVAFWNEFGGTMTIPEHNQAIFRSIRDDGTFNRKGRFVKKAKANYETMHRVKSYTITRLPRPFFRRMISLGQGHWGADLSAALINTNYKAAEAMATMGMKMKGELQDSIQANVYAPLAKSTIARKGNEQQLIESGQMWNGVDYEVSR